MCVAADDETNFQYTVWGETGAILPFRWNQYCTVRVYLGGASRRETAVDTRERRKGKRKGKIIYENIVADQLFEM